MIEHARTRPEAVARHRVGWRGLPNGDGSVDAPVCRSRHFSLL